MSLEQKLENVETRKFSSRIYNIALAGYLGLMSIGGYGCKKGGGGGGGGLPSPGPNPNNNPVINSQAITNSDEDQSYAYDVNATDADNDTLVYSLTQNPNGMTINANSGLISWADPVDGVYGVNVQVSDGRGGIANQNYILTIDNKHDNISGNLTDILTGNIITSGVDLFLARRDVNGNILNDFTTRSDLNGNYLFSRIPTGVARLVVLDSPSHYKHKAGTLTTNSDKVANFELISNTFNINFYNEVARRPVDGGQTQRWLTVPQVYINTSPALGSGVQPNQQEIDLVESIFRNDIPRFNNGFTNNNITITKGTTPPTYPALGVIIFEWDDRSGALGIHVENLNGNEINSALARVKTGLVNSQQLYVNRQEITQPFGPRNDSNIVNSIFNDPQTPGVDNYQQVDLDTGIILYKRPIGNKSENGIPDSNPDNTQVN